MNECAEQMDPETNTGTSAAAFDQWAIVDVMGHQRFIGRVTEQVVAGCGFIRVDVPANPDDPAATSFTKLLGTGSIYSISPISEAVAMSMIRQRRQTPIEAYELPASRPRIDATSTFDEPAGYTSRRDQDGKEPC